MVHVIGKELAYTYRDESRNIVHAPRMMVCDNCGFGDLTTRRKFCPDCGKAKLMTRRQVRAMLKRSRRSRL